MNRLAFIGELITDYAKCLRRSRLQKAREHHLEQIRVTEEHIFRMRQAIRMHNAQIALLTAKIGEV